MNIIDKLKIKYKKIMGLPIEKEYLKVADFSILPGLRTKKLSIHSAEEFYETKLEKSFKKVISENKILVLDLDGILGYAPCFIDESIGRLVYNFTLSKVKRHLHIISEEEPCWIDSIESKTFPQWETKRRNGK